MYCEQLCHAQHKLVECVRGLYMRHQSLVEGDQQLVSSCNSCSKQHLRLIAVEELMQLVTADQIRHVLLPVVDDLPLAPDPTVATVRPSDRTTM